MRVAIDLDGVCYNFTAALAQYIEHETGVQHPLPPTCWEFYEKDWDMSLYDYLHWFKSGVNDGYIFRVGEPAPGCIDALNAIREAGHTIHLITDRNVGWRAKENTAIWLEEYCIPYDTLTFCDGSKDIANVDIAVDDRPEHVDAFRARGIEAYVMGFDNRTDMIHHPWYIEGWDMFLDILKDKALHPDDFPHPIQVPAAHFTDTPSFDAIVERDLMAAVSEAETIHMAEVFGVNRNLLPNDATVAAVYATAYPEPILPPPVVRTFSTGATRDLDDTKHDPEGFYTPRVITRFCKYMTKNRHLADGTVRDSDNWQKGIPREVYMKSLWRHFLATWGEHRRHHEADPLYSQDRLEEDLCGVLFNTQGMLDTILKERGQ